MLKLMGFMIKASLIAVAILIAGQIIPWNGKSISDQLKIQMSHAENSNAARKAKTWVGHLLDDADSNTRKSHGVNRSPAVEPVRSRKNSNLSAPSTFQHFQDEFSYTEKQKLRELIRELNSPKSTADNNR